MRLFGNKLFGRKGLKTTPQATQPGTWPPTYASNGDLTIEGVYARCEAMARGGRYTIKYYLSGVLSELSPAERTLLIVNLVADASALGSYDGSDTRDSWIRDCCGRCLEMKLEVCGEHLPVLLTLFLNDSSIRQYHFVEKCSKMLGLLDQALKDGGFLTSADLEQLGAMASELRASAGKARGKPQQKAILRKAEAIEKLAGLEVSATSLLLERCEGAENPFAMGPKPTNYEFWAELIAETIAGLHAIKDDLQGKGKPAWMKNAETFAETWPAVGPIAPRFRSWNEASDPKLRDFTTLRGYTKHRHKGLPSFADPARVRDLSRLREIHAPTMDWRWDTPQIPALDVLADIASPHWTALLEHLITGRVAPRPTATWLKQGVALAEAIGADEVAWRLGEWLSLFHVSVIDDVSLADRVNAEVMDRTVVYLNENLPDWPASIGASDMARAGRALAMLVASQTEELLCKPFAPNLIECNDHIYEARSVTRGKLRIQCPTAGSASSDGPVAWLKVSLENEALLRGAMWLCAELAERGEAIAMLEAMAKSGAGRCAFGDQGHRSRVVANAAIATLTARSGADIDAAIFRLSRAIPDRTINMPLFKALNQAE